MKQGGWLYTDDDNSSMFVVDEKHVGFLVTVPTQNMASMLVYSDNDTKREEWGNASFNQN